jgi:hypothetical protein
MKSQREVASVQARQYGLITVHQFARAGVSPKAIRCELERGGIERVHRGVYVATSSPSSYEQKVLSAILACGGVTFASHATGAWLSAMTWPGLLVAPPIEVTTLLERRPRIPGVRVHRSGLLLECDIRNIRGIPVASPERTLVDLSSRLTITELGPMLDDALRRKITTLGRFRHVADRLPMAPGRSPKTIEAVLAARIPGAESELEKFVLAALQRFKLPPPDRQVPVYLNGRKRRIDSCYTKSMLAIEALGFEYHGMRSRFDDDALRGNELLLAGYRVLEFTSAFDDWTIASQVAQALGLPAPKHLPPRTFDDWLHGRR